MGALTHINYAFAFIDPQALTLTTMDSSVPVEVFSELAGLKAIKPDLQIFVSVGGWSFSDNDTATQPLFGEIARDPAKRQTFANNVLSFMNTYGFDGVDLDWFSPSSLSPVDFVH